MVRKEESNRIKVRVRYTTPVMKDVLPLDYETEFITYVTAEDEVIPEERYTTYKSEVETVIPSYTIPKGTGAGDSFIGANNNTYDSDWIYKCTGKSIADIFEKY